MVALKKHHWIFIVLFVLLSVGITLYFTVFHGSVHNRQNKPHIVIILADDVGWNDFGFHGSSQIPTPNIDALAYNGIILDRFYTQAICTPSRTALLTGNYPIRSGMQGSPLKAGEDRAMPYNMSTMAERLKNLGYRTHLVGKWHLGSAHRKDTPTGRGFDSHFGYWHGFVGYFDYVAIQERANGEKMFKGFDLHDGFKPAWSAQGRYATELFTDKSLEVIDEHSVDDPLFLVVSHLAGHTGQDGTELGVPNGTAVDDKYPHIKDPRRRLYAEVMNAMDVSVGKVMAKLSQRTMLQNSIVLFLSDNGAPTVGTYENSGSNWPLRGMKFTEFEGGVRGTGAIFSPLFTNSSYVNKQLMHLVDILPTFYRAAGGNVDDLGDIDGIDQWQTLSENSETTRDEVLVNIDEVANTSAVIIGKYKFLKGAYDGNEKYVGESGRDDVPRYDSAAVQQSIANIAIQNVTQTPLTEQKIEVLRSEVNLAGCRMDDSEIDCTGGCLFDLESDLCETTNIIGRQEEIAKILQGRLDEFWEELVPQTNKNEDAAADPANYNNTWCTWLDDDLCFKINKLK